MKKHLSKRRVIVSAFVVLALAIASSVAYAYWTSNGSGSNTVLVSSTAPSFTVAVTLTGGPLVPGGSANVGGTVTNPGSSNTTSLHLSQVVGATTPVVVDTPHAYNASTNPTGCKASDFTLGTLTITGGPKTLAPGDVATFTGPGSLAMFNDPTNSQDGCKGATITLNLVAS